MAFSRKRSFRNKLKKRGKHFESLCICIFNPIIIKPLDSMWCNHVVPCNGVHLWAVTIRTCNLGLWNPITDVLYDFLLPVDFSVQIWRILLVGRSIKVGSIWGWNVTCVRNLVGDYSRCKCVHCFCCFKVITSCNIAFKWLYNQKHASPLNY